MIRRAPHHAAPTTNPLARWLVAIAACAIALMAPAAHAQGTGNVFIDPMDYEHVHRLLAPLELSDSQRAAVDDAHAEYIKACLSLRESKIRPYLDEHGSMPLMYQDDVESIEDALNAQLDIFREQKRIEESFFAAIGPALNDTQMDRLPMLVDRRERERTGRRLSALGWSFPEVGRFDVSRTLARMDLSPDETDAAETLLAPYESSITQAFRRIYDLQVKVPAAQHAEQKARQTEFDARMAELTEQHDLTTDEGRKAFEEAARDAIMESSPFNPDAVNDSLSEMKSIRDELVRVSRMSRNLVDQLAPNLSEDNARRLARDYQRSAYRGLNIPRDVLRTRVLRKTRSKETEEELVTAINGLYDSYLDSRAGLINNLVREAEKDNLKDLGGGGFVFYTGDAAPAPKKDETAIEKARQEIRDLNTRTLASWAALTGEEVPTTDSGRRIVNFGDGEFEVADGEMRVMAYTTEADGGGGGAVMNEVVIAAAPVATGTFIAEDAIADSGTFELVLEEDGGGGGEIFVNRAGGLSPQNAQLPGPLDETVINDLSNRMNLDDTQREMLESLHQDYKESFATLENNELEPIRTALRSTQRFHGGEPLSTGEIADVYNRIPDAVRAVNAQDEEFFETIDLVFPDRMDTTELERVKWQRGADVYNDTGRAGGMRMFFGPGGAQSSEGKVNLAAIVNTVDLNDADRAAADRILHAYLAETRPLFEDAWEARLNMNRQGALDRAEQREQAEMTTSEDGNVSRVVSMSFSEEDMRRNMELRNAASAVERNIALENREAIGRLMSALSAAGQAGVSDAYQRRAFPSAYRDRGSLNKTFQNVVKRPEVSESTRRAVEELWMDYRNEYDVITQRIVDRTRNVEDENANNTSESNDPFGGFDQEAMKRAEKFRQDNSADVFERDNLNQRTRGALAALLDPNLAAELGLIDRNN